ncbi:hypothetical protein [Methylosinus sp. Ce-a6]|uniref:hypothetical protein n=1 Tax=Methylosinus sp. Ce-a6 TaxID=2172005 RepID=UPI00135B0733|nr:hypothetical protein [Methylosinus sp. Ce-a6]
MIDLIESLARALFVRLGSRAEHWDDAPIAERDRFRRAAEDVLHEFTVLAPFEPTALVEKIRETRPTRLGFLYMAYSLNTAEAAALLAFRALARPSAAA